MTSNICFLPLKEMNTAVLCSTAAQIHPILTLALVDGQVHLLMRPGIKGYSIEDSSRASPIIIETLDNKALKSVKMFHYHRKKLIQKNCKRQLGLISLERGGHDSGDGFEIDLLCLDVFFLVGDEDKAGLRHLPPVLVDPLVDRVLVDQPKELVQHLLAGNEKLTFHNGR